MAEHMPTDAEVRESFVDGAAGEFIGEDFDRWLAEVRREAAEKAAVEVGVCEHQNANYLRMMSERDKAERQAADLRGQIEALAAEYEKPNPSTLAYRSEVARAVLALLPGRTETEVRREAWDEVADYLDRTNAPSLAEAARRDNPYRKEADRG